MRPGVNNMNNEAYRKEVIKDLLYKNKTAIIDMEPGSDEYHDTWELIQLLQVFNTDIDIERDAYNEGYEDGYVEGKHDGENEADEEQYHVGYSQGYNDGYFDGAASV